jgi:hypothetical protein
VAMPYGPVAEVVSTGQNAADCSSVVATGILPSLIQFSTMPLGTPACWPKRA